MRLIPVSMVCVLASALLPGQQLINPANWLRIAPQYQLNYLATAAGISFNPYCGTTPCKNTPQRTGIVQFVTVPNPGLYEFRFQGKGGGTGWFHTQAGVAGKFINFSLGRANWHVAQTVSLPRGNVVVWITTDTSNLKVDHWSCLQPSLVPVLKPAVEVDVANAGLPNDVKVVLSTSGNILAASLTSPAAPIRIPGFTHGLHLSPNSMVILGVSATGGLSIDLSRAASRLGYNRWPKIYLQAATMTGFGSRSWF